MTNVVTMVSPNPPHLSPGRPSPNFLPLQSAASPPGAHHSKCFCQEKQMRLRSNRGRHVGTPLRLERLDDRSLPSVTFVETNGTLYIRGDQQANTIVISDDGSTAVGNIVIQADGQTYISQTAITNIRVYGRG